MVLKYGNTGGLYALTAEQTLYGVAILVYAVTERKEALNCVFTTDILPLLQNLWCMDTIVLENNEHFSNW